jgi:acetylornithine deacetylase/succinyl-diaminopimelate desuccinylase-like protein
MRISCFATARRVAFALLLFAAPALAAGSDEAVSAARSWRGAHGAEILAEFSRLLSLPNYAREAADIQKNADAVAALLQTRRFAVRQLTLPGAPPLLYAERRAPGAARTVAIYIHYDGQPAKEKSWSQPPFEPTLYTRAITDGGTKRALPKPGEAIDPEWRLYARSAGDDKAPIIALSAALDALEAAKIAPTSNIKLFLDGEEEIGSPHLGAYLAAHRDLYADVDLWLFCDGPVHQSGRPQLVFGARGVTSVELTVYGANRELHSGHYGNWAPVPGNLLAHLLASMKAQDGRVLIKDFDKDTAPISAAERAAMAKVPNIDADIRKRFGLAATEKSNAPSIEEIRHNSLTFRGIESGYVGDLAKNAIPTTATASIEMRLAPGADPRRQRERLEAHVAAQGYTILRADPTPEERLQHARIAKIVRGEGYRGHMSAMEGPAAGTLKAALAAAAPDLLVVPLLGGSLPLYEFADASSAPIIILPIANYDNNQHGPDENLRIGNLWYGIDAYAAVLTMEKAR